MIRKASLIPILLIAAGAMADTQVGEVTPSDPTWDRPTATGANQLGPCKTVVDDSVNDDVHYDVYYVRAETNSTLMDVHVLSLEQTPLDFDPMIVVYCGEVDPNNPDINVDGIDDDTYGYPNAELIGTHFMDADSVYSIVVSSYSNYPQSQFGKYEINLGPGLYFSTACLPDFSGDGAVNFFDVSIFMNLFNSFDPAADLNHDGNFNFFDISAFLAAFNAGCP